MNYTPSDVIQMVKKIILSEGKNRASDDVIQMAASAEMYPGRAFAGFTRKKRNWRDF